MISLFLTIILSLTAPALQNAHTELNTIAQPQIEEAGISILQTQNPESLQEGDESAYKPFSGFNILGYGMIILILIAIGFVIIRVFKRMNKTRGFEGEKDNK